MTLLYFTCSCAYWTKADIVPNSIKFRRVIEWMNQIKLSFDTALQRELANKGSKLYRHTKL